MIKYQVYWQGQACTAYTNKSFYGRTLFRELFAAVDYLGRQGGGVVLNDGSIALHHKTHIDPPHDGVIADVTVIPGSNPVGYVVIY